MGMYCVWTGHGHGHGYGMDVVYGHLWIDSTSAWGVLYDICNVDMRCDA